MRNEKVKAFRKDWSELKALTVFSFTIRHTFPSTQALYGQSTFGEESAKTVRIEWKDDVKTHIKCSSI